MTLVAEPAAPAAPPAARPRRAPLGSWRFAARLARREVRRRPGRTALVAALVAVPVAGMGVASVAATTTGDPADESFARRAGGGDVLVQLWEDGPSDVELRTLLPARSTWLRSVDAFVPVRTPGGDVEQVVLTDVDLAAPLAAGIVDVRGGVAPARGEVLLSSGVAEALGVVVGERLVLARPEGSWRVAGIGRLRDDHAQPLIVMPDLDSGQLLPGYGIERLRIDVPDDSDVAVARLASELSVALPGGSSVETAHTASAEEVSSAELAWGWVAGAVALAAVGVVIAAAFATSARRQLATIGQLSANGAPPTLVRRTLALQGTWSGLVGGVVGLAATLLIATTALRPSLERLTSRDVGAVTVAPAHLAVILATAAGASTIAALLPARSAARIPVLAALAGRRPLGSVPRQLVPVGVALFLAGLGLLAAAAAAADDGAAGNLVAGVAVVGGLGALAGMCCASPLAVAGLRRLRVGGTARLAVRSLVRQRSRSAAVVTAIATVGALSIAGATVASRAAGEAGDPVDDVPVVPADAVVVHAVSWTAAPTGSLDAEPGSVPADLRAAIERIAPGARSAALRGVAPAAELPAAYQEHYQPASILVADDAVLDLVGLSSADAERLRRTGVLAMRDWGGIVFGPAGVEPATSPDLVIPPIGGVPQTTVRAELRRDLPASWGGSPMFLMTPARAAELGWVTYDAGVVLRSGAALTSEQRDALGDLSATAAGVLPGVSPWVADQERTVAVPFWLEYHQPPFEVPPAVVEATIVGVALLLTLLVVAIGLALAAAEGRDERDVLVAVGARPSTLRRLAGMRAVALTMVAAVLAVPTGYLPIAAVVRAVDGELAGFPWLTAAGIVVVVPLLAGGVAWLASMIAQRARPATMSTLSFD